jgi:tRNA(adenine34) deaminase
MVCGNIERYQLMNGDFKSEPQTEVDEQYIREALREAEIAFSLGEAPIGAVIVCGSQILARGHNLRETSGDPTAHAEIIALREASKYKRHWRLTEAVLYTTLEPCPMCAGAMVQARIKRLVFGAKDPKAGAAGSLMNIVQDERLNHRLEVTAGVLAEECGEILKRFFKERRSKINL